MLVQLATLTTEMFACSGDEHERATRTELHVVVLPPERGWNGHTRVDVCVQVVAQTLVGGKEVRRLALSSYS